MHLNKTFKQNLVLNDYLYKLLLIYIYWYLTKPKFNHCRKKCYDIDNKPDSYLKIENIQLIQILTNTCLIKNILLFYNQRTQLSLLRFFPGEILESTADNILIPSSSTCVWKINISKIEWNFVENRLLYFNYPD